MDFDDDRAGSGTKEWAEVTVNICRGCANDCRYCYAAHNAVRFRQRDRADWGREEFTKAAGMTSYPKREGVVMFPSSHDITPFNVAECIRVAKVILAKGNKLLIVSKPRMDCIDRLLDELDQWKGQILLRFTMGTIYNAVSSFWEPHAPPPLERLECLMLARKRGFSTSVSIEPMLEGVKGAQEVVEACRPFVTDSIWIGKMNRIGERCFGVPETTLKAIDNLQCDAAIMQLYWLYERDGLIRWKDSIKKVIERRPA